MSVSEILQHSSNVGTIRVAGMLGKERLDHYLRAFGFGVRTGLDFPGEADGIMLPLAQLQRHEHGLDPDRQRDRGHRAADARGLRDDRQRRAWRARPGS